MKSSQAELDYWREYRSRPEIRARERERAARRRESAAYRMRNNQRNREHPRKPAWDTIRRRVQKGTLKRQPCVFCGKPDGLAHHEDYNKPLSVVWVCHAHHAEIHAGRLQVLPRHIIEIKGKVYAKRKK